jgi:hypothetical protein
MRSGTSPTSTTSPNCDGDPVVYHRSATNMKALPATDDPLYVAAFIKGWAKFDGTAYDTGTVKIRSPEP